MPISKPRRILGTLAAVALAGTMAGHALLKSNKPKIMTQKVNISEKIEHPFFIPEPERVSYFEPPKKVLIPNYFKVESDFYSLFNQKDLATRKILSKDLRKRYPYEHIDLYERYFDFVAKQYNLDPELFRYLFFRSGYDLNNPALASDLNVLSRLYGQTITRQDILDDPFLSIDLSAKFLDYLKKSKQPKDKFELLTYFRFGNVPKKDLFTRKVQVIKDYGRFLEEYYKGVKRQKKEFKAKAIINRLVLPIKNYKMLSSNEFNKLTRQQQIQEIQNFVRFLSDYLELPSEFILTVIDIESGFNYMAQSPKNAIGLMQLKLDTLYQLDKDLNGIDSITGIPLGKFDLFNPYMNIVAGMIHFKYLYEFLDSSYEATFMAYNMGLSDYLNVYPISKAKRAIGKRYLNKVDERIDRERVLERFKRNKKIE